MENVIAVVDLQFGSTGKGQVAGLLAKYRQPDTVVCANGPNAGHTFQWEEVEHTGQTRIHKIVCRALPCGSVMPSVRSILIGPGAVIDVPNLLDEILTLGREGWLRNKTLCIHPMAPVVNEDHIKHEMENLRRVGSTMKGTGEALVSKIRRDPKAILGFMPGMKAEIKAVIERFGGYFECTSHWYDRALDSSELCLIEGSQGFSLGIHTDFYPYTTSRDVSIFQLLADCRIPARLVRNLTTIGVVRTYPIRVANRYDENGVQVGSSGTCYEDQNELEWEAIGREPELTTVTKLPRRLFSLSTTQLIEAARVIDPDYIVLNFCDYIEAKPALGSQVSPAMKALANRIYRATQAQLMGFGYGPNEADMLCAAVKVNVGECPLHDAHRYTPTYEQARTTFELVGR